VAEVTAFAVVTPKDIKGFVRHSLLPHDRVADFRRRLDIGRLSLFRSALRDDICCLHHIIDAAGKDETAFLIFSAC